VLLVRRLPTRRTPDEPQLRLRPHDSKTAA
jgi:hypothetical protein